MPIYEYAPDSEECVQCGGRFQDLQGLREPPHSVCPHCGQGCHRVPAVFSTVIKSASQGEPAALAREDESSMTAARGQSGHDHDCSVAGCYRRAQELKKKYSIV